MNYGDSAMPPSKLLSLALVLGLVPALPATEVRTPGAGRPLTTDRPDSTESPFTVEPGRVQLEMDFANHTRDRSGGATATETEVAPFNLRFGVATNFELGVFAPSRRWERESSAAGPVTRRSGWGDVVLRAKQNWIGNDGGFVATGTIVDLKLPTATGGLGNGKLEGEVMFPVAFAPGGNWHAGVMTAVALVHDGNRYDTVWGNTVTCCFDLSPVWEGVVELTSAAGEGTHAASFNCAIIRKLGPDMHLDAGVNFGISRNAPDLQFFAGLARRF